MSNDVVEMLVVGSHAPGLRVDVDELPLPGETILGRDMTWPLDGGKGSNQALAAAELGARVAFVGRVGTDVLGDDLVNLMGGRGIDIQDLSRSNTSATGCGVNIVDSHGRPEMVVIQGANAELAEAHVAEAIERHPALRVVLTQMEINPVVALHAARLGKQRGALSIVNAAPPTVWPLSQRESAETVDILIVNETEATAIDRAIVDGVDDEFELAARLQERVGARVVIITLGERGMVVREECESWRLAATQVAVVDTSGAGDVFCAALAVALAGGNSIRNSCTWANIAAGVSVTRSGTIPSFPNLADVDAASLIHERWQRRNRSHRAIAINTVDHSTRVTSENE